MPNPPEPCPEFSACWCEQRPNNPNCKPTVPIDDNIILLFIAAMVLGCFKIWKIQSNK